MSTARREVTLRVYYLPLQVLRIASAMPIMLPAL
jgi:hypothetical protein